MVPLLALNISSIFFLCSGLRPRLLAKPLSSHQRPGGPSCSPPRMVLVVPSDPEERGGGDPGGPPRPLGPPGPWPDGIWGLRLPYCGPPPPAVGPPPPPPLPGPCPVATELTAPRQRKQTSA